MYDLPTSPWIIFTKLSTPFVLDLSGPTSGAVLLVVRLSEYRDAAGEREPREVTFNFISANYVNNLAAEASVHVDM